MNNKIKYIAVSTHEGDKKIAEIAFFNPLEVKATKQKRRDNNSLLHKGQYIVKKLLFKKANTKEDKLIIFLALFLSQESMCNYYLKDTQKREQFAYAVAHMAQELHIELSPLPVENEKELIKKLTTLTGKKESLLMNKRLLYEKSLLLPKEEREQMLYLLLKYLEQLPLTSIIEMVTEEKSASFSATTQHGRTEIFEIDSQKKQMRCKKLENILHPSSIVHTLSDQHLLFDSTDRTHKKLLCGFCGNLENDKKVLEQILFILNYDPNEPLWIKEDKTKAEEFTLCFTSFYSWHELDLIGAQKMAIENLNQKVLFFKTHDGSTRKVRLHLLNFNIPLSNWYEPRETKATLADLNDETLIQLSALVFKELSINCPKLAQISALLQERYYIRGEDEKECFLRQKELTLMAIDQFRLCKADLIKELGEKNIALSELLMRSNNQSLGIEQLLYINNVLKEIQIVHNHNSNRLTKLLASQAIIKAQKGFEKMEGKPFIPKEANEEAQKVFSLLYTIYMMLDEPRIHAMLSGGYLNEEYLYKEIYKNRELSHYLSPLSTHFI